MREISTSTPVPPSPRQVSPHSPNAVVTSPPGAAKPSPEQQLLQDPLSLNTNMPSPTAGSEEATGVGLLPRQRSFSGARRSISPMFQSLSIDTAAVSSPAVPASLTRSPRVGPTPTAASGPAASPTPKKKVLRIVKVETSGSRDKLLISTQLCFFL